MVTRTTHNYTSRVGRRGVNNNPARRQTRSGGKLMADGQAKARARALRIERGQSNPRGYHA